MHSIITSYLLQTGKSSLPHIGSFSTEYTPAINDMVNKVIIPPAEKIVFTEGSFTVSPGLVQYTAVKKNIPENEAMIQLDNFCKEWKGKIDAGEILTFETLGSLQKNEAGNILFSPEESHSFFHAVPANRVINQDAEHSVLVGDRETTSAVMNEYYSRHEKVVPKTAWRIRAAALFLFALGVLIFSFYNKKFSTESIGNRVHFTIKNAGETHFGLPNQ